MTLALSEELPTAEALIVEALAAHLLLGSPAHTFPGRLHVKPHLDRLDARALLRWEYDEEANFLVTPTELFVRSVLPRSTWADDESRTGGDPRSRGRRQAQVVECQQTQGLVETRQPQALESA